MSYCRFLEGDVYIFSSGDEIVCAACSLTEPKANQTSFGEVKMNQNKTFDTKEQALQHLYEHRENDDRVPQKAIDRLKDEID